MTDHVPDTHQSATATGPLALKSNLVLGPNAQVWTCFHCGEVCADAETARLHFGASETQQPGCQIDLAAYRRMEEVNRRHCEEDTELHRALHRMECKHQQALRREEEAGYAKGLRDGRAESIATLRALIPVAQTGGDSLPLEHAFAIAEAQRLVSLGA